MARIDAFLKLGTQQGCSDIHLAVGRAADAAPARRPDADQVPRPARHRARGLHLRDHPDARTRRATSRSGHDLDFSYVSADGGRFRVNVFRKDTGVGAVFRAIPTEVPTLDKLALPPVVKKLCDYHQGMILVTGATGTGKSTTLAAMIDQLNTTRQLNIISLEDPDRVRPPQQDLPGDPARARHPPARASPRACARPCARTRT